MTFFVCDGNSGDLYRNQVLLKLAKRKDGSFADFGSDPVHDGQAFKITKSNWIERQPDPLPDTKEKFERYVRWAEGWEGRLNRRSSGSVVEFGSNLLSLPIAAGEWTLDRQTLKLS